MRERGSTKAHALSLQTHSLPLSSSWFPSFRTDNSVRTITFYCQWAQTLPRPGDCHRANRSRRWAALRCAEDTALTVLSSRFRETSTTSARCRFFSQLLAATFWHWSELFSNDHKTTSEPPFYQKLQCNIWRVKKYPSQYITLSVIRLDYIT